jgi:light-regulated signal transduction histidine kinase (bacteriophytochrome)
MSQVQERLAAATSFQELFELLTSIVKELAGFHRVKVYEFDPLFNGRVVSEQLGEPIAGQTHFEGLTFPASDVPTKVRELYKLNKVRTLYDCDLETAQLVYRTAKDLENTLDLTHPLSFALCRP